MTKSKCPANTHFHVAANDAYEKENFSDIYECAEPNEALHLMIQALPATWEGSIEVNDDKTLSPSAMPLIDFWRAPAAY